MKLTGEVYAFSIQEINPPSISSAAVLLTLRSILLADTSTQTGIYMAFAAFSFLASLGTRELL